MSLLKILYTFSIVVIIGIFVSCELINPEEQIPSYIRIDSIGLSAQDYSEYGSSSHKISDAWVYIDNQPIGAFELAAKFPVLWEGTHTVTVKPGIKVNGISATRSIYPFYKPYVVSLNLVKDSIITLNPMVTYFPSTVKWNEDFEKVGITLEETLFSDTTIVQTLTGDPEAFEGYSGVVHLDAARDYFECKTIESYTLPSGDNPVFLELNYKTNEQIYVGVIANSSSQSLPVGILYINKSDVWNKIYINLNNAVNSSPDATDYQIFFSVRKSADNPSAEILFDNIKLLHN